MPQDVISAESVQPAPRGWFARNWLWAVPTGCLVVLVLCVALCIGVFGAILASVKSSEPYRMALEQVRSNPKVIEKLGEPIREAGWFPSGTIETQNDSGSANLAFEVMGPKGVAQVQARARRIGGKWGITTLDVTPSDGKRISLDQAKVESGLDEAPRWTPPGK